MSPLSSLIQALDPPRVNIPIAQTALVFDTNVLLRMSRHPKREDIVDYISVKHKPPFILPGQAIQEFWNNLFVLETVASGIRKHFEPLKTEIAKLSSSFGSFSEDFGDVLDRFTADFGAVIDPGPLRAVVDLLKSLESKAIIPFAQRLKFAELAANRKATKTPPGFKDDGHGDFYIWIDLLKGLLEARASGGVFDQIAFVTLDKKPDWQRNGSPHPLLTSEVSALLSVPFVIWTLDQLVGNIEAS